MYSNSLFVNIFVVFVFYLNSYANCDRSMPVYKINLDLPPEKRWNQVAEDYKNHTKALLKMSQKFLPLPLLKLAWFMAEKIDNLPDEYAKEIQGMSKVSGIPVGELIVFAVFYDVFSFGRLSIGYGKPCTGIIARDKNGTLYHGRNFDYLYGETLKNMTIIVDFQRSEETVFSVTTFAFFTGMFTGQKPNRFTLNINERDSGTALENLLMAFYTKFKFPVGIVVRQVLEYATTYEDAVKYLSTVTLVAPVYFIVAGTSPKQGVVITRDRLKPANVWSLAQSKNWYLLETNYDHWKPVPSYDQRRIVAQHSLDTLGQSRINAETLFKVLSTPPVKNGDTIFTTVMSAAHPELFYEGKIRS